MCGSGESITAVPALISWKFIKLVSLGSGAWVIALRRYRKVLMAFVCVCVCVCVLKRNRSHFIFPREAELSFGFETFSSKCPLAIGGNRSLFSQQAISDSFVTRQTEACQASLSRGFFRQGCWSGLPFPSPGDIPNPGNEPESPALAGRFFTTSHLGSPVSESRREWKKYRLLYWLLRWRSV